MYDYIFKIRNQSYFPIRILISLCVYIIFFANITLFSMNLQVLTRKANRKSNGWFLSVKNCISAYENDLDRNNIC